MTYKTPAAEALPIPGILNITRNVQRVLMERGTDEHPISPQTRGQVAAAILETAVRDACEMWGLSA